VQPPEIRIDDGNDTAFTRDCICGVRLRSGITPDQVDASNAAFQCTRGRMEMQQVGVDPNDLRVQSRQWCTAHVRDGSRVGNFYQEMAIEEAVQRILASWRIAGSQSQH
jgi:hypothetical protein